MIRVVHVVTGLDTGGAETMLYKLLSVMNKTNFHSTVVSLTDYGELGRKIRELGIDVTALGMRRGIPSVIALTRLEQLIRRQNPSIVQTWMYHADLMGGIAARMAGRSPVIWNIRHSNLDPDLNKRTTLWTVGLCSLLSRHVPARIVCNSEAAREIHERKGFRKAKFVVIPNGFDVGSFRPDRDFRDEVHTELGLVGVSLLVGLVARFDPQKDHRNFIGAASMLSRRHRGVHYLLCGDNVTWGNDLLAGWIRDSGVGDRFHLLGKRSDMPRITASLDVAVSSSRGEGFSNVIGEAMSCAVPCVATSVGDSVWILADTGIVVPPRDPQALATALEKMIEAGEAGRQEMGRRARQRVIENFSLEAVVRKYEDLYLELGSGHGETA